MTNPYFENQPIRFVRLLTPGELPGNAPAVRRHKSSEHQLPQGTLVQGNTIAGGYAKRSDSTQAHSLRLPKLPSDLRLQQFLRRKKIITGLTPRIGHKVAYLLLSSDPSENMPPIEKPLGCMSSTSKGFKTKDSEAACEFAQKVSLKVQSLHRTRASCSQSPDCSVEEEAREEETPRRSLELEVVLEHERPQTIESKPAIDSSAHTTSTRPPPEPEDLNTSGILMAKKMKIAAQTRASLAAVPISESGQGANLPVPPKPKKRRAKAVAVSMESKPNPEQQTLINTMLYSEFNQTVLRSNGMVPASGDNSYKFFLGPGNNSQLIAFLMKRRWYWARVDAWQQAEFIWTQNKQASIVEKFEKTTQPLRVAIYEAKSAPKKASFRQLLETERGKSGISLISNSPAYLTLETIPANGPIRVYNRIERNYQLTSKKRLFTNLVSYYTAMGANAFDAIPVTFLIENGRDDPQFEQFAKCYAEGESMRSDKPKLHNLWIIKPGENTNCGHGIHVSSDLEEIKGLVSATTTAAGRKRTYIVQKYIEKPLLVNKRKFDIRCYGMITCFNGHVQGYFYHDGYLRTSSKEFTLKNISNRFIHLTNDAVQKKSEDYGKFENGNKLSYPDFQRYLEANFPDQVNFWRDIWPQIKRLMTESFQAVAHHIDPHRRKHTFEVLGYDFMIDEKFKVWLIEVNTNPCLSLSSAYLAKLIPTMLDNAFRIAVDPYFQEPSSKKHQGEWAGQQFENRFEVVYSSGREQGETGEEQISVESDNSEESGEEAN